MHQVHSLQKTIIYISFELSHWPFHKDLTLAYSAELKLGVPEQFFIFFLSYLNMKQVCLSSMQKKKSVFATKGLYLQQGLYFLLIHLMLFVLEGLSLVRTIHSIAFRMVFFFTWLCSSFLNQVHAHFRKKKYSQGERFWKWMWSLPYFILWPFLQLRCCFQRFYYTTHH